MDFGRLGPRPEPPGKKIEGGPNTQGVSNIAFFSCWRFVLTKKVLAALTS